MKYQVWFRNTLEANSNWKAYSRVRDTKEQANADLLEAHRVCAPSSSGRVFEVFSSEETIMDENRCKILKIGAR